MTSPRTARLMALGASLSTFLDDSAALPRWVFRALSVTRCRRYAAALTRTVPDLRPQTGCFDYRYDG